MVFVTGDTHGSFDFNKVLFFVKENKNLTPSDYLIICGDFGGLNSESNFKKVINLYKNLPLTVLFVDGNHENFPLLNAKKVENWQGGKVHKLSDNLFHLMRGQVFTIENKTFLTMGGAQSADMFIRQSGLDWFKEELPTQADFDVAFENLAKVDFKVDFIITHSVCEKALYYPPLIPVRERRGVNQENVMLSAFEQNVSYGHWYFGHYHVDCQVGANKTCVYNEFIKII